MTVLANKLAAKEGNDGIGCLIDVARLFPLTVTIQDRCVVAFLAVEGFEGLSVAAHRYGSFSCVVIR